MAAKICARHHGSHLRAAARSGLLVAVFTVAGTNVASAYFGDSFLNIPETTGKWQGAHYKNWIRVEESYWPFRPTRMNPGSLCCGARDCEGE
jgi:hypothetical protein